MRVGKKANVVEAKKTRSCVVRLEKVGKTSPNVSPSPEDSRSTTRTRLSSTTMTPTPKGRRGVGAPSQHEEKPNSAPIKKKVVGNSNFQTPQQQKLANANSSNIRSNQKIKIIPRSNKTTPASTPSRDETPPPTIAAGRSRRAIKPNPKYASEDLVTPKVVRNVAHLGSSTSRAGSTALGAGKNRKASTSSDDFYNRNSDDEYENNLNAGENDDTDDDDLNDKVYQVNEKDEHDSDYSVIEEQPVRPARLRGRPKKIQESTPATTQHTKHKLPTQTPSSSMKRNTTTINTSNLRSAPSQLQQIRRSLASANAQRNLNMLVGSGGTTAQKRKLEETQDSSDNDSSYTITRKQLLLSNSSGIKVKVPVKENRVNATSTPITKNRLGMQKINIPNTSQQQLQQQTLNGSNKINHSQQTTSSRRAIEISAKSSNPETTMKSSQRQSVATAILNNKKTQIQTTLPTTQAKILAAKANRLRSNSPKLPTQKERQNKNSAISISSTSTSVSSTMLNINTKASDKTSIKSKTTASTSSAVNISENKLELKDDSPNSTMDDFETMPTFTIVNVNDIINKKGDVLITKSKSNSNKTPTVIEFSESISLGDDDDEDDDDNDEVEEVAAPPPAKKMSKLPTVNNRKEFQNKKMSLTRATNASLRKLPTQLAGTSSATTSNQPPPQILNHKLGLRNSRVTAKTTTTLKATLTSPDKPAPRILNSVVAKKTQPVKPMIANMDDSADESFPLSLDEDEDDDDEREEETEDEIESRTTNLRQVTDKNRKKEQQQYHNKQKQMEVDNEDTESQNTEEDDVTVLQASNNNSGNYNSSNSAALTTKHNADPSPVQRRRRTPNASNTPIVVSSNKKRLTPAAAKENSLAATNPQVNDPKQSNASTLPSARKSTAEKVVISKQGDKIIKKITCFETWYVINMPLEPKRPTVMKNQLEMPLIRLANSAKNICLPNGMWSSKVTLYELSPQTLAKGTFATFTGDLNEHNIKEEDRAKYQPSCVMFRRSIEKSQLTRMPYDRAVIFKNKTFYTNIEGKNVRLVGAPSIINTESEIEILLQVVDGLTLQSDFVEHISIVQ